MTHDPINHPVHYTAHPSGIECIDVTRHMGFNLGNAVKYIWRADLKNNAIEDLKKAIWYLQDEIKKREAGESVDAAIKRDAEKRHPGYAANGVVNGAELVKPEDLWVDWRGGRCPVKGDVDVEVRLRSGRQYLPAQAECFGWEHGGGDADIVSYRVVE